MRNAIGLAILAGAFSFAGGAEAAPPALSDHAAISRELVDEWNAFIRLDELKLTYRPDCGCGQ